MDDELAFDLDIVEVERAILNESEEGRALAAAFVAVFGDFVREQVRPQLREIAASGGGASAAGQRPGGAAAKRC